MLLDGAHPPDRCADETSQAAIVKQRCKTHMQNKRDFMDLYCVSSLDYGEHPTELHVVEVREAHAKKVHAAGVAYVNSLKLLYPECRAFYPHAMAHHCADDIREFGCPIYYAQEADEAKNLETKNMLMRGTNHQIQHRLLTVMKRYNMVDCILDGELSEEPQLLQMLDRKAVQKSRYNDTRKKTVKRRTCSNLADLKESITESSDVNELLTTFKSKQEIREESTRIRAAAQRRKKKHTHTAKKNRRSIEHK